MGSHEVNDEDEKAGPDGEEGEAMLEAAGDDDDMKYQIPASAAGAGAPFNKPVKKFTRESGGKSDKRVNTPQRDARANSYRKPSCIHCGKPGNRTAECPEGRRDNSARPCFKLGNLDIWTGIARVRQ